jgi:hypothetical protein
MMSIAQMIDAAWAAGDDLAADTLRQAMDVHIVEIHDMYHLVDVDCDRGLVTMTEFDDGSCSIDGDACYDEHGNVLSGPISAEQANRLQRLNARGMN